MMNWILKIVLISATINLASCCNRMPVSMNAVKSPADDRYHVGVGGNPQSYEPLQKYNGDYLLQYYKTYFDKIYISFSDIDSCARIHFYWI